MSEPKRYTLRMPDISYGTEESVNGEYVRYEDYASLKAEVDGLTKAGDEVIREWSMGDETSARNFMKALVVWNAAKEGKQS